jgi:hypothetical protein
LFLDGSCGLSKFPDDELDQFRREFVEVTDCFDGFLGRDKYWSWDRFGGLRVASSGESRHDDVRGDAGDVS